MNLRALRNIGHVQVGVLLAVLIVAWSPFSGGPRMPSLLLAVLGGWLLWRERGALLAEPAVRRLSTVFALLLVPVLLSVPGSVDPIRSAKTAIVLAAAFLTALAILRVARADRHRAWIATGIGVVLVVWIVDGYIQYLFGKDLLFIPLAYGRVVGFFVDNLRLSLLVAVLLPVLVWLPLRKRAWLAIVLFVAGAGVAILGGSRMILIMLAVVGLGLYLRLPIRRKLAPALIVLAVLVGVASFSPGVQDRFQRFAKLETLSFETIDYALSWRLTIWHTAANMFLDRPLTGVGVGTFATAYDRYSTRPKDIFRRGADFRISAFHAHQMYVSAAAETGIVGLAGLLAIFVLCVKWFMAAAPERREQAWPWALGLLVIGFPINSQPILFLPWWFPIPLLLVATMLAALDGPATAGRPAAGKRTDERRHSLVSGLVTGGMMRKVFKQWSRTLRIPFNRYFAFRRLKEYHARPRTLEETVDWAMNFGGGGFFTVKTLQIPSEITALARAVEALKPKVVLEIGTARGGTLLIWSRLASERVITCDLQDMSVQAPLFEAFPPPGSACKVTLLSGNSHDPAFKQRVAAALDGRKADFLFIDGDHTEGGVTADYNDYREFVRPGGIIAFHDIVESQPLATNQVYHLWKRIKREATTEEFVNNPAQCGFGIGVVRV